MKKMKLLWHKLKGPIDFEKKKKDKGLKMKRKPMTVGRLRKIIFLAVFLLLGFLVFVTVKANAVLQKNHDLKMSQATLSKKLDKASAGSLSYNPLVGQYFEKFLNAYYNYNQDQQENWRKGLKPYFSTDLSMTQLGTWSGQQSLKDHQILGIFSVDGIRTAQYSVTLENNGKQSTLIVNIPYEQDNAQFTVVGLPYVSTDLDTVGHVGENRLSKTDKALTDDNTVDDVTSFTKTFLQKYVSSSKDDMALLMDNPQGLAGKVDMVGVDNIKVSGTQNNPVVTAVMTVQVHDTDIKQNQQIRLQLKKQNKTYFVTKMMEA